MSRKTLLSLALAVAVAGCGGGGGGGAGAPSAGTALRAAALAPNQGVQGTLSAESPSLVALDPEATDGSHFQAYEITLPREGTLTLLMKSKAVDSHLQLFDASFLENPTDDTAFIAASDDVGTTLDAMISEKLPAGTYVVLAGSAFENADEGAFSLTSTFTE